MGGDRFTVCAHFKFLESGSFETGGIVETLCAALDGAFTALCDELPERVHVCAGDDLVACAAEEEHGSCCGYEGDLGSRIPLLVAEEGEVS